MTSRSIKILLPGFLCTLLVYAGCGTAHNLTGSGDRPTLSSTIVDESLDDLVLPAGLAGLEEGATWQVTATMPFCCDANVRIFEVQFTTPSLTDRTTCRWDFDDGRFSNDCSVRHRYNWDGLYAPSVTVTMSDGSTMFDEIEVTIGFGSSDAIEPALDGIVGPTPPNANDTGDDVDLLETAVIDIIPENVRIEFLSGPDGDVTPGSYEVSWRFLDAMPKSGVHLRRGCCECQDDDSPVLTPDESGVYTTTVDIPNDRSAWYMVRYTLADTEYDGPAIHVNVPRIESSSASAFPQPTIIWPFVPSRDDPESLAVALRSKLITHVAIFSGNRITSDTLDKPQTLEAIQIAKDAGVELILIRFLWQSQPSAVTELGVLLDPDYYAQEIELTRQEADRIGAAFIGFDTETYGQTPLNDYFRSSNGFLEEDLDALAETIDAVVGQVGQVDFILPAGAARPNHPYTALAGLGKQRISEGTYYDNEENIAAIKYPYELSGMYMNVIKKNERLPWKPYFLPNEVFIDKAYIWRRKEGLMIWPRENRAGEVAGMMAVFAGQCAANPDSP